MLADALGAVVREHRGQWRGALVPLVVAGGLALLPALGLVLMPVQRALLVPFGVVFGVIAAIVAIQAARDATMIVTVHERGVSWSRGRTSGAFAFADVTAIEKFAGGIQSLATGNTVELPATGFRIDTRRGTLRIPASLSELPALMTSLTGNV